MLPQRDHLMIHPRIHHGNVLEADPIIVQFDFAPNVRSACKDITQCSEVSEKSSNRSFYPKIIAQKYLDYDTVGHARVSSTYPRSHQLLTALTAVTSSQWL